METIPVSNLSQEHQTKFANIDESWEMFAKPHGRGYSVKFIEKNLVEFAQAQHKLDGYKRVVNA